MFQYGGVHLPLEAEKEVSTERNKNNSETIQLYELGLILEESNTFKKGFETKLNFFVTGDFLSEEIKNKNMIFKWGLCQCSIDLKGLIYNFKTPEEREEEINKQLREIPQHYTSDNKKWTDKLELLRSNPLNKAQTNFK